MDLPQQFRGNRQKRKLRARRHRSTTRTAFLIVVPCVILVVLAGVAFLALDIFGAFGRDLPQLSNQVAASLPQTTKIYAADGQLLAYLHKDQNRTVIANSDIPDTMKHAVVAIEDKRFYQHNGVDYSRILGAFSADLKANKVVQGGSTITMQLVKNLYLGGQDTSITDKIYEASLALQYEKTHTKDTILTNYLNTVFFGANAYGLEAAAQTYFGEEPKDLTVAQAALLAGLLQAPSTYDHRRHPKAAITRRHTVLLVMLDQNYITQAQYQEAIKEPLKLASSPYVQVQDPYVVDYVKKQLVNMFGADEAYGGGLMVETSINPAYQKLASQAISSLLNRPGDPASALVSIDPKTGFIRAMVSSTDYSKFQFNLAAQAQRQPGSAFKMFCLTAAIEEGIDPNTTYYASQPLSLQLPGTTKPWTVHTFSNSYAGVINLVQATLQSDNTVYAQLVLDVGVDHLIDVAKRMGITSYLNANPAIVLGGLTYGVTPLEMASAYGTLADRGVHVQPTIITKVTDASGKVLYDTPPKSTQAISAVVSYAVTQILQENVQQGTGVRAQIGRPAAGKTGTATDFANAWFCGYTPDLATAVWVGYPQGNVAMTNVHGVSVQGGSFPAEIWAAFMKPAETDFPVKAFAAPQTLVKYDPFFQSHYAVPPTTSTSSTTSTTSTSLAGSSTTVFGPPTTSPPTTSPPTTSPPTTSPPTTSFTPTTVTPVNSPPTT